jgi:hypothetical protein
MFYVDQISHILGNIKVILTGILAQISQIRCLYVGNHLSRAWDKYNTTLVWFLREQKHTRDGLWPGNPDQRPSRVSGIGTSCGFIIRLWVDTHYSTQNVTYHSQVEITCKQANKRKHTDIIVRIVATCIFMHVYIWQIRHIIFRSERKRINWHSSAFHRQSVSLSNLMGNTIPCCLWSVQMHFA